MGFIIAEKILGVHEVAKCSPKAERPEAEILTKAGMVPIKIAAGEEVWEDFGA